MAYQVCRWYDLYPRLAFGLKLLYLAPASLRCRVTEELLLFLEQTLRETLPQGWEDLRQKTAEPAGGNRWYDESDKTAWVVELIKESPEHLKALSTEKLLASLSDLAA